MKAVPLKYLAQLRVERRKTGPAPILTLDRIESGTGQVIGDVYSEEREPPDAGFADVESGDVLFGKLRPYLAKVLLARGPAYASTELLCLRPRTHVNSRWFAYRMLSRPVVEWAVSTSEGTKMPRTSWEHLGSYRVPTPGLREQRAIADFLDCETARIDALILKRGELSKRVRERHRALITALVDSDSKVRRVALRRVAKFVDYRGSTPNKTESGVPLVTASNVREGTLDLEVDPQYLGLSGYYAWMRRGWPRRGDVVITTEAPLGEVAQIADERVALAQRLILLQCDSSRVESDFLAFALRAAAFQGALHANATGSTALGIKADRLKALSVPLPPLERQRSVSRQLRESEQTGRTLLKCLVTQVSALQERRQALITAAVTGETEIPGVAA